MRGPRSRRLARVIVRVALGGLVLACGSENEPRLNRVAAALPQNVLINEVEADPPGADGNYQYVELIGPEGADLSGHALVALEADSSSDPGEVDWVTNLETACSGGTCSLGSNGLLLLTAPNGHSAVDERTVVVLDSALAGDRLENGSLVLLLVHRNLPWDERQDWDIDNDCALDLPAHTTLLDAVGWLDGDPGDCPYAAALLTAERPAAASRFDGEDCSLCAQAWYEGTLAGSVDTLRYGTGMELTPGGPNLPRPGSALQAGGAGDTGLPLPAQEPTRVLPSGGHAGSGGAGLLDPLEPAGSGEWQDPLVVVALHSEQAGDGGAASQTGPEAGIDAPHADCLCHGTGRPSPPAIWWTVCIACWAAGPRRGRLRHSTVARRLKIS